MSLPSLYTRVQDAAAHRAWWLIVAALTALLLSPMLSHSAPVSSQGKRETVALITGPTHGTYHQFGHDIAQMVSRHSGQHSVAAQSSKGSIDNIKQMIAAKGNITLGIVQSDILGFLGRSTNDHTRDIASRLSVVFPFYHEEIHILARKDIKGLRDLAGKRVIVGQHGSGNMLTSMNMLALAQVKPGTLLHSAPDKAVVMVLSGQADAMIFVGGKPVPLFTNMQALRTAQDGKNAHLLDEVHFIPIDDQRIFTEYSPTRINAGDYDFVDQTILTAQVTALLMAYQPPDITRKQSQRFITRYCAPIRSVAGAIAAYHQPQQVPHNAHASDAAMHAKWSHVNLYAPINAWKRSPCVWDGNNFTARIPSMTAPSADVQDSSLNHDLLDIVRRGGNDISGASPTQERNP